MENLDPNATPTVKNSSEQNELSQLLERLADPQLPPEQRKSLFSEIRTKLEPGKRSTGAQSGSSGFSTETTPQVDPEMLAAHSKLSSALDSMEAASPETQQWKDSAQLLQAQSETAKK